MTRRARSTSFGSRAQARSRMAPGGRTWSERTMPRPARQRVPAMGEPVDEPVVVPPTGLSTFYRNADGTFTTVDIAAWSFSQFFLTPGSSSVITFAAEHYSIGVPSGWRVLATGTCPIPPSTNNPSRSTFFNWTTAAIDLVSGSESTVFSLVATGPWRCFHYRGFTIYGASGGVWKSSVGAVDVSSPGQYVPVIPDLGWKCWCQWGFVARANATTAQNVSAIYQDAGVPPDASWASSPVTYTPGYTSGTQPIAAGYDTP